jgi:hypothetical protein
MGLTEFFPPDDLNYCGAISIEHAVQPPYVRKAIFAPKTCLKSTQSRGKLYQVIIQSADAPKRTKTLLCIGILCCKMNESYRGLSSRETGLPLCQ